MSETQRLQRLVNDFAKEMKRKLLEKKDKEGYYGWDDAGFRIPLESSLQRHVERAIAPRWGIPEDFVDVANLAAFLWYQAKERRGDE